jgi:hypothetical protein
MGETELRILELAGIIFTAIFAIYALLKDFKNKDGSITKHGKKAILLIMVSLLGSLIAKEASFRINQENTKIEARKHLELLNNINRNLYPINDASIDFRFYFNMNQSQKENYRNMLLNKGVINSNNVVKTEFFKEYQFNSKGPWRIDLPFGSPIFPGGVINYLVRDNFFTVEVYKKDVTISDLSKEPEYRPHPELAVEIQTELEGSSIPNKHQNHKLHLDIQDFGYDIEMRDYFIKTNNWYKSGGVTSALDLLGALLVVRVSKKLVLGDVNETKLLDKMKSEFSLKWITIDIRGFPRLCMEEKLFTKYSDFDGYPVFVASIPNNFEEISKLHPNETLEYQSKPSGAAEDVLLGWFRLY